MRLPMARKHLRRVTAFAKKLEQARLDRDQAIREAWNAGETYRDIGRSAGLSHTRVQQIVMEWRIESPPE